MNNPPAFQFYPKDFLVDANVQAMTLEETGAYIRLLCICWIEDGIPAETVSRVVALWLPNGLTKDQPTVNLWSKIKHCFYEKDGKWRNKRLDEERKKQIVWSEKSRVGGLKSGESKRLKKGGYTKDKPKANQSRTKSKPKANSSVFSLQSSSSLEDSRESSIKADKTGRLFDSLWSQWPNEGRFKKKICRSKFQALVKRGEYEDFRVATLGYSNYLLHKKENEGFAQSPMHLATWLNNWKEEAVRYVSKDGVPFQYKARL